MQTNKSNAYQGMFLVLFILKTKAWRNAVPVLLKGMKRVKEIWKDIKGYEGLYQVSSHGRVKRLGNNKTKKEMFLVQHQMTKDIYMLIYQRIIKRKLLRFTG